MASLIDMTRRWALRAQFAVAAVLGAIGAFIALLQLVTTAIQIATAAIG